MVPDAVVVGSGELAACVDKVDEGKHRARYVYLREDALVKHEAVRVAIHIVEQSRDRVRAVPGRRGQGRSRHVDLRKEVLRVRLPR